MANQIIAFSTTDGPTLTAAAAASALPTNVPFVLPAGYFQVGRAFHLRASGRISCVVTTPGTARFDMRIAGVVAFDTLAMPLNIVAKTNVPWILDVYGVCRAAGSSTTTTLLTQGFFLSEASILTPLPATGPGPGGQVVPYNTAPVVGTGFNCQTANTLDFFFTQTVATGSMTMHQFYLEQLTP
jgi:hypothetical protein